jgi:hypothetical protein
VIFGSDPDYGFSKTQWVEGAERVLARLTKIATNVVVLAGTSHLSFDGPSCLEINLYSKNDILNANDGVCKEMTINNEVNKVSNYLNEAVQRFRNARLLDLNDLVCPNGLCGALDYSGHVVFRDSHHLTDSFVSAQVAVVRHRLLTLGVEAELVEP